MAPDGVTKAFNQLHSVNKEAAAEQDYEKGKRLQREQEVKELLADNIAPVTTEQCIPWILEAWERGNYFRLLGLPAVEVNALGKPTWECSAADVSKAYRKLSALVHPDKAATAAHPDGRLAFERLNEAARILKNPAKRADEIAKRVDEARKRRALQEASATSSDRVARNATRASEAQQLRQRESSDLAAAMKRHADERRAAAAQKRALREQAETRATERSDAEAHTAQAPTAGVLTKWLSVGHAMLSSTKEAQ